MSVSSTPSAPATAGKARGTLHLDARATLFGFDEEPVQAEVIERSRAWRVGGAARIFAVFVVVAPFVAVFPPHAVWLIGALATGAVLARRRYVERYTLVSVEGRCPRCQTPLTAKKGRLKRPHPLPCEGCNHEPSLRVPDEALRRPASD